MVLYEKFLEIKLEERDNYIKELQEQGKTAQDIKDMFLQDKPTGKKETSHYNAVKKRVYPHINNIFGVDNKRTSTTVKKAEKQVYTECTQDVPQKENEIILEILDRVEKLEQAFNKPTMEPTQVLDGEYINTGIRINKSIWKEFNEFCSASKDNKQIVLSKALYEYMQNHN